MPIEIKELIIKVTVDESKEAASGAGGKDGKVDPQELMEACVEKVMELLNEKNNYR